MSSDYHALCLSHSPGLHVDSPQTSRHTELEAWLMPLSRENRYGAHASCDLVGGRFCMPMVEVYCPGGRTIVEGLRDAAGMQRCQHVDGWVPTPLLRALSGLIEASDEVSRTPEESGGAVRGQRLEAIETSLGRIRSVAGWCWTQDRLRRLLTATW